MAVQDRRDVPPVMGLTTDKSRIFFVLTLLFYVLAVVWVALRVYARRLKGISLMRDDYMVFAALVLYTGQTVCTLVEILLGGMGHHAVDISPEGIVLNIKLLIPISIFYASGLTLAKCSICSLYSSIFFIKPFRIAARAVMALNIAWGIWASMNVLVACTPIAYLWDRTIPGGHCLDHIAVYISVGVIDIIVDACIFLLPIPMVWNLHLPLRSKIGLYLIFGTSIIAIVISCLRTQNYTTAGPNDFTYEGVTAFIWTQIGLGISIMIASSLVLRPVVEKLLGPPSTPPFSSSALPKSTFTRMDDGDLRRGGSQPRSMATASGDANRDLAFQQGLTGRSGMLEERTPQGLGGRREDSGIKVHTEWKVSTIG